MAIRRFVDVGLVWVGYVVFSVDDVSKQAVHSANYGAGLEDAYVNDEFDDDSVDVDDDVGAVDDDVYVLVECVVAGRC